MMRTDMAEHPSRPDTISEEEPGEPDVDPIWRSMLMGDASMDRRLRWQRRLFKPLPSNPRCKVIGLPVLAWSEHRAPIAVA